MRYIFRKEFCHGYICVNESNGTYVYTYKGQKYTTYDVQINTATYEPIYDDFFTRNSTNAENILKRQVQNFTEEKVSIIKFKNRIIEFLSTYCKKKFNSTPSDITT